MNTQHDGAPGWLTFDPLVVAERITGKSFKDDEETVRLGMGLAMMHNAHKETALQQTADSYFNMTFTQQLGLFGDLGFADVYRETFEGHNSGESFVILWHPEGLLATCESYGAHRNSAKVYYNYRTSNGGVPSWNLTSSGRMCDGAWVGDHDAREGIRHALDALRAEGDFMPAWIERPFLWLLNYAETKGDYDYAAINAAKIARLPEHVRNSITPSADEGVQS